MNTTPTTPWQSRLAAMDHTRGTSNKMVQAALKSEINDLRKMLKPELVAWRQAKLAQTKSTKVEERLRVEVSKLRATVGRQRRALAAVRKVRDEWRAAAQRYQKQLLKETK